MDEQYEESFSRNIGILTPTEQETLARSEVVIAGMGGIGGTTLIQLCRSGVGRFRIADFDSFELANINRQHGARIDSIGRPKCEVIAEEARKINPSVEIDIFEEGFTAETADSLLGGADVVVDAIDFYSIETHLDFHRSARKHGLFILMGSPVGFSACLQIFDPAGMSLEEYCGMGPDTAVLEKQLRYACGLVPEFLQIGYFDVSAGEANTDFVKGAGPSMSVACTLAASMVATEVILLLTKRRRPRTIPHTVQFDPYTYSYACTHTPGGMTHFDPQPAIERIGNSSAFVPRVLDLLYQKRKAVRAPANGAELYCKVEGAGEPLLLIPPLGADSSFWVKQVDVLAKDHSVILFDPRGSGESSGCPDHWSTESMGEDVISVLDHLGIESAHLVGLALGGLVAQQVAARHPNRVRRVVMASGYVRADHRIREKTAQWREAAETVGVEELFENCLEWLFSSDYIGENRAELEKLDAFYRLSQQKASDFCKQSLAGIEHEGESLAAKIQAPVLVIQGGADRLVGADLGRRLAECISHARLVTIAGAPHFMIWECPEQFNQEVLEFLSE